jgi:signal transduction histidine kinase
MVAHEMVIQGMYGDLSIEAQDKLKAANKNLARPVKLVNDLLDLEKLEAGQMPITHAPTSVAHQVEQSIGVVENLAVQHCVQLAVKADDSNIDADGDRLEQAVVNLLSHSIKTAPPQSVIEVSTQTVGNFMTIVVRDQAPPVPADQRQSIFDRFNPLNPTASARSDSTVGPAICKPIVESHGGTVSVYLL